jgi:hypothetical protein
MAAKEGYTQPCAVTSDAQPNMTVRIELMPESAFDVPNAPRPRSGFSTRPKYRTPEP